MDARGKAVNLRDMRLLSALILSAFLASPAPADDIAGDFDYYVLALSWSPSWCRETGDDRDADQCDIGRKTDFVVHGLWPQYEQGWPQDCRTSERDPSRRESAAMADVMGSGGLAWYQWKKHGRCSGLSASAYYQAIRDAARSVQVPEVFDDLAKDIRLPPSVVEEAFIDSNPALERDGVTVTCRRDALQEVRICLTRNLEPRSCASDIGRDCGRRDILMERLR